MRKLSLLISILLTAGIFALSLKPGERPHHYFTNYHISSGGQSIIDNPNSPGFLPGDTLFIDSARAASHAYLYFEGLRGAPGNPIVIINNGYCQLPNGMDFANCQYVEVSGQGHIGSATPAEGCGIKITGQFGDTVGGTRIIYANDGGPGLRTHWGSKNIYWHHVEINKMKYGLQVKDDEECDTTLNYPNGRIDSIEIAYLYIHNTESQGMYMGTTQPNNYEIFQSTGFGRAANCSFGNPVYLNPGRMANFNIHHNKIRYTGRGGIQLSVAQYGTSWIHDNDIDFTGCQTDDAQGGGITLGSYTKAIVNNNTIKHTLTYGIINYGTWARIYDNSIDSSGWTLHYLPDTAYHLIWASGITNETRFTTPVDSSKSWIWKNVISHVAIIEGGYANYAISWDGAGALVNEFAYDNRHDSNSYNGTYINAGSNRLNIGGSIHVAQSAKIITPLVNAERDYMNYNKVKDTDTTLYGGASAMGGTTITSHNWSQISGPNTATISSPSSYMTNVTGLAVGGYVFRLTATQSNGQSMYDDMYMEVGTAGGGGSSNVKNYLRLKRGVRIKIRQ